MQEFVRQDLDAAPDFPKLVSFLDFWKTRPDGALHSVSVSHRQAIPGAEIRVLRDQHWLH